MIEVADYLVVELRERGLEDNVPQRILSTQLIDSFIPDDAYSSYVRLQGPSCQGTLPSLEGPTAGLLDDQKWAMMLKFNAALQSHVSEMLREVNSGPLVKV